MDNAADVLRYAEEGGLALQGGRIVEWEIVDRDRARAYVWAKDQHAIIAVEMVEVGYLDEWPRPWGNPAL